MTMRSFLTLAIFCCAGTALAAHPGPLKNPLTGYLVKVEGKTLTVTISDKGAEVLVQTDEKTKFTLDGETITVADLLPNMPVKIYQDEGITTRVEAKAPKPRKK